jgi:hypothetical protein
MVLVSNSWRVWLAGTAASLVIFAVVYFAVIAPSMNTANQAIKSGVQQSQQVIKQAQQQLSSAGGQGGAAATGTVQKALGKAAKLTACVEAAGTDPTKMQACQVKYSN